MAKNITSRNQDFSEWYQDIIDVAGLAEHSGVKGSMVIKPYGYSIWENIQKELDFQFKETGVENAYFPLLIPESFLKKEAEHIEGFSPELAVVTIAGGKPLAENLIIRPTSETIIYDSFKNWISSHRDLPLLINQWANVVRWEKRPRMFLRTTEFLWQEGHTAHSTYAEADLRARGMLEIYKKFCEDFLAISALDGVKSENEKFAGADKTYTIEAIMQDGKALQLATSHNLAQNFSKAFGIKFSNKDSKEEYVYQTSWGLSTRSIGGLIMSHSDDNGLVLPPKIAPIQVVIIPIYGSDDEKKKKVIDKCKEIEDKLRSTEMIRVKTDLSEKNFGEKSFFWEKRGVPVRIEIGPKDLENNSYIVNTRQTLAKEQVGEEALIDYVLETLLVVQRNLLKNSYSRTYLDIKTVGSYEEFKVEIEANNSVFAFWDGNSKIEERIKEETKATTRCIPFKFMNEKNSSLISGNVGSKVLFSKAY